MQLLLYKLSLKKLHIISPKLLLFCRGQTEAGLLYEPQLSSDEGGTDVKSKMITQKILPSKFGSIHQTHTKDTLSASQLESFIAVSFLNAGC